MQKKPEKYSEESRSSINDKNDQKKLKNKLAEIVVKKPEWRDPSKFNKVSKETLERFAVQLQNR